jgi:hypothetical protein
MSWSTYFGSGSESDGFQIMSDGTIVITITNNIVNVNAQTLFGSYYTQNVVKKLIIYSGVTVSRTSGNTLFYPPGMLGTITLDNRGSIIGYTDVS